MFEKEKRSSAIYEHYSMRFRERPQSGAGVRERPPEVDARAAKTALRGAVLRLAGSSAHADLVKVRLPHPPVRGRLSPFSGTVSFFAQICGIRGCRSKCHLAENIFINILSAERRISKACIF